MDGDTRGESFPGHRRTSRVREGGEVGVKTYEYLETTRREGGQRGFGRKSKTVWVTRVDSRTGVRDRSMGHR